MNAIWQTIIGGAIALIGAVGTQWIADTRATKSKRRSLAGALAGEIDAICVIARTRRYLELARELIRVIESTGNPMRSVATMKHDYFVVFHSNSEYLGLLPKEVAMRVSLFYTQVKSLTEDLDPESYSPQNAEEAKRRAQEQINLMVSTFDLGDSLVDDLKKI